MGLADRPDKARGTNARWPEGLKDRMMTPEVAEEAMHASAEETNRFNRERRANSEGWRTELVKVEKAITAMISAIEEGLYQPSMKARMDELERQKADLMAWLAGVPADVPDILPNVSAVYRKKVERLVAALNEPKDRSEAAEAIRGLIEKIALRPGPQSGRDRRDLARRPGHDPELDRSASYWHKRKNRHPLSGSRGNVGLGGCGSSQLPRPTLIGGRHLTDNTRLSALSMPSQFHARAT